MKKRERDLIISSLQGKDGTVVHPLLERIADELGPIYVLGKILEVTLDLPNNINSTRQNLRYVRDSYENIIQWAIKGIHLINVQEVKSGSAKRND